MEFGIFNDEGLVEGDFASLDETVAAIAERYTEEDEVHAAEICRDHPGHERESCEKCND